MRFTTPGASPDPLHGHPELRRRLRDRAARKRLADRANPELPIDGDPIETRVPTLRVGSMFDGILNDLLVEKSAFFDAVCAQWKTLFPDLPAYPGRYADGHLFIYVRTSGQLFALRPKLPKIKKALMPLRASSPDAPKRLYLNLEIHSR